jgi:putative SOS response-associated peptidase YedK
VGISEGLSRVSWKLSRTVLRGGAASNGGSLLDKKTATGKQPYAITQADRRLMALAGLWENWRSPAGEWVRSFAIITTMPNALCAELHNRMPVVLKPESWPAWLGEEAADPRHLKALLAPYPADEMVCWPVSQRVGNVKNNDPSLIEPIAVAAN